MTTVGQLLEIARGHVQAGHFKQAETVYRQLTQHVPQAAELWAELGYVELKLDRVALAVEYLERAARLAPQIASIAANLATAYRTAKQPQQAVDAFHRALSLDRPTPELLNNLGLALKDLNRHDEALEAFDRALALRADYANGHLNRANLLRDMGRLDEAADGYLRSLASNPADAGAHCSLASIYYDLGRFDDALVYYDRAIALDTKYAEPHRNRALIWLARGDFARGWPEYDYRLLCEGGANRDLAQPRWDGAPLAGRALLVYAEQGLGDTLQAVRYLPWIERGGATVWLEAPDALRPILNCSGFARFLPSANKWPRFDVHSPIMSLARFCGDPIGEPYWPGPYLASDPGRAARWRAELARIDGFKIGIVWAGNPDHPHDRYRSAPLSAFTPLAAIEGARLISLQKGPPQNEVAELAGQMDVIELSGDFDEAGGAFMDTAAVIGELDLVVSVDTAVAHLAGGMGREVWLAIEFSPDWRWRDHGETTPWYPATRLFRQRQIGHWEGVFQEIAEHVRLRIATRA